MPFYKADAPNSRFYSNVSCGNRLKGKTDDTIPSIIESDGTTSGKRKEWASRIQMIYEVDPLICPKCKGTMKIISVIEQTEVIKAILQHVGLWETQNLNHKKPNYYNIVARDFNQNNRYILAKSLIF